MSAETESTAGRLLDEALERIRAADMPLEGQLSAYADVLRRLNRPFAEAVDRLVERLLRVDAGSNAPAVGDVLPPFMLPDEAGHLITLEHLLAGGPLVVAFRRGHWCPYCMLATDALARISGEVTAAGGRLTVITPDLAYYTSLLKARTRASFPILTDLDNAYGLLLGLAISVGDEVRHVMSDRGRDLAAYQGNGSWFLPIPATFVLDQRGRIVARHVDPDYRRRMAIESIVAAVKQAAASTS